MRLNLEHVLQTERDTVKFRLLALLAIAISLYLRKDQVVLAPAMALVLGYLVYGAALDRFLLPRFPGLPMLVVMFLADIGTVLAALATIGTDTPVFILVPLVIVYFSLYLGYAGSLAAATLTSIGYAGMTLAAGSPLKDIVSIQIPFFYVVALLTGYLASQRFREREEKRALQQVIEAETRSRDMLDVASQLIEALDPAALAADMARMGALAAGAPLCILFHLNEGERRLAGFASNVPPESLGLPPLEHLSEPLEQDSPGARIARGEAASVRWTSGSPSGVAPPAWMSSPRLRVFLALPFQGARSGVPGVAYFLDTAPTGAVLSRERELKDFVGVAAGVLSRVTVAPQAEQRGEKLLGELRQTVERMGRFRELQGRQVLRVDSLVIDPARERVAMGNTPISLSKAEFDVLYILAEKAGAAVSKETLLREVWGPDFVARGNVVDVCVHRLRRKLARTPDGADLIRTVRGQGYMIQQPRR
ncbi:MAG: winged helix-turn-helix transcriptional regulator [Chloroflexi bacterium]|nr:winged helix-turn-helix transcriptional regulator [Chloroflexota bacterium]